jgi:hypothetical protein
MSSRRQIPPSYGTGRFFDQVRIIATLVKVPLIGGILRNLSEFLSLLPACNGALPTEPWGTRRTLCMQAASGIVL